MTYTSSDLRERAETAEKALRRLLVEAADPTLPRALGSDEALTVWSWGSTTAEFTAAHLPSGDEKAYERTVTLRTASVVGKPAIAFHVGGGIKDRRRTVATLTGPAMLTLARSLIEERRARRAAERERAAAAAALEAAAAAELKVPLYDRYDVDAALKAENAGLPFRSIHANRTTDGGLHYTVEIGAVGGLTAEEVRSLAKVICGLRRLGASILPVY